MPYPDLPEFAPTLAQFDKDHEAFVASPKSLRTLKSLALFSRDVRAPGPEAVRDPNAAPGARLVLDWLSRLPPVLVGHDQAPFTDFAAMEPKQQSATVAEALQALAVGGKALLLGAVGSNPDTADTPDTVALAVLQLAFGADSASAKLRKALLDPKGGWPHEQQWPMPGDWNAPKPGILAELVLAGTWREWMSTFARCGLAAQQSRDWSAQVRGLGRVAGIKPARACAGQKLTVSFADFGPTPAAGSDVVLAVPTRNGCVHFALSRIAPGLFRRGWKASGTVAITLPTEVYTGALGFFLLPPPMKSTGGCEAGSLSAAAGMLQSALGDVFGPAGVITGQVLLNVAYHVEAGGMGALPCATRQPDGLNMLQAGPPVIDRFVIEENRPAYPEGTLTLAWSVANADSVQISRRDVAGSENLHELPAVPQGHALPASGRITLQIPCTRRWEADYVLQASNLNACTTAPVEQVVRVRSGFSDWRLGVGKADITDRRPGLPMAGFAYMQQKSLGELQRDAAGDELPLFARGFYVGENTLDPGRRELVIVVADIWTCTIAVKREVVKALNHRFPPAGPAPRFDHANVMIAGTHTHAAPGGYSDYALYNLTLGGFDQAVFNTIVAGIALAAAQAVTSARPGRLFVNNGNVPDCGVNRSMPAFERNPECAAGVEPSDREMLLLKFMLDTDNRGGTRALGALNWYAIHPTALGMYNRIISGDNKGWAAAQFERAMRSQPQAGGFVAAFGNASAGDISGNYFRDAQGVPVFRRPLGGELPDGGSFPPRWPVPGATLLDEANMKALGEKQFTSAQALFDAATEEVTGRLDMRHAFIDMGNVSIDAVPGARTWPAALGVSFGAGSSEDSIAYATMDGFDIDANIPEGVTLAVNVLGAVAAVGLMTVAVTTSLPGVLLELPILLPSLVSTLTAGTPLPPSMVKLVLPIAGALIFPPSRAWVAARVAAATLPGQIPLPQTSLGTGAWQLPNFLAYPAGYETGHGEKPIMFPVGLATVSFTPAAGSPLPALSNAACPLVPQVLPMQLVRIGSVGLAGVPAELTATAGRRLKQTVLATFGGVLRHCAVAGYCNGYSGYVSTREEYGAQHYEGASTLYGEHTLMAYQQVFSAFAAAMGGGPEVVSAAPFEVPLVVQKSSTAT